MNNFADLEIRILQRRDEEYPVEITLDGQQESSQGYLSANILPWTANSDPVYDGQRLFDALLADSILRSTWDQARGQSPQRRIRLRINKGAPELHTLPWELLRDGDTMLSANGKTPFSRYLPVFEEWGGAVENRPIRVLVLISNPNDLKEKNLPPLDVETERNILTEAFSKLDENEIELDFLDSPVTLERLGTKLHKEYHIIHYLGHGTLSRDKKSTILYMQDEAGNTQFVDDEQFSGMLSRQRVKPRLVFLAACQSAARSTTDAFRGLGPKLVNAGIPAIVAMQDKLEITTARKLSQVFYQRLAEHGIVDYAMNEARSVLLTAGRPDAAVPVLFMRLKDGQLWKDETENIVASSEAVTRHRTALREQLETNARDRWGGMSAYIQEEGATLPIEASPYQTGRLGPRENLLQTLHTADRLLVLGEPGSGKTVSLERLAWELCDPSEQVEPIVPVLVRLFRYDGTPLLDWVRALLQRTGHLRLDDEQTLTTFLKEGSSRCVFLFDGLNEVPPDYRNRLVGELVRWMSTYPRHPVILTSRAQDELWRRLRGEVEQIVVVQPIGDEQARDYLLTHLSRYGTVLYKRLDDRLRTLARTPLILWLIKEAGAAGESVPGNRGELYARFVSRMLRRDTDRRIDTEIPERIKRRALRILAYHLGQKKRLLCSRDEAMTVVAQQLGDDLAEKVVGACARHGLLAGDDLLWFSPHQTVQEHFAALALREIAVQEWSLGPWEQVKRSGQRLLTGQDKGLASLAADDWWMETFVQLAGLVDDADQLVQDVVRVNPWLAWWCVEEGQDVAEETRKAVEDRSVGLLKSKQVQDRRRAVQTLAQIQNERVPQLLFDTLGDRDAEVARLAIQTLVEMGESARAPVAKALQSKDQRQWRLALRYLHALPDDLLWAEVPKEMWDKLNVKDRRCSVTVLARVGSDWAAHQLFRASGDKNLEVAQFATQMLVEMGESARAPVAKALQSKDQRQWRLALRYLRALPDDLLWAEVPEEMWDEMLEARDRCYSVVALTKVGDSWTVQLLLRAAGDEDSEVAGLAVQALARMGEAAQVLVAKGLESKDRRVKIASLRYVTTQPNNSTWASQPLFLIAGGEDAEVAGLAVQVLVEMGEAARVLVTKALQGEDQHRWRAALRYLEAQREDMLWSEIPERVWEEMLGQPMAWVPSGPFPMGSDKEKDAQAHDNELPQHEVTLPRYWIGRYPVTVAQFRAFIEDSGYKLEDSESLDGQDDHPVVKVTWYDAVAFCRWISEKTGLTVMLPSEAEWEKAARGTDERIYPWGDRFDKNKCNVHESGIQGTTPVGKYSPAGDSPYGCADMAGNVWEWTRSLFQEYPYQANDGREDMASPDRQVVRGGKLAYGQWGVRCASRYHSYPYYRYYDHGFRVVVASPVLSLDSENSDP
ncbi:MAG: SUMF1/EgtB/PvdO family nonheme iron enzyme [Chloroflexi bacterium]|nr:SUMF1/EgtB/PvdO family nonheme iron enzyme [Chloroflexota bacterium]